MGGQCHWVYSVCGGGSGGMMVLVSHEWEHGDIARARVTVVILILITLMVLHVFFCVCFLLGFSATEFVCFWGSKKQEHRV